MNSAMRIVIIYNQQAGQKKTRLLDQVKNALETAGHAVDIINTTAPGHATSLARHYKEGAYDVICAAGGDGTIREVLAGLYPSPIPFGIIPLGTANVLAKEILPNEKPATIARVILQNHYKSSHLGIVQRKNRADDAYFGLMASVGPDAESVHHVNLRLKNHIGKAAYALSFLKQVLCRPPVTYRLTIEGVTYKVGAAILSKGKYYGGRFLCAPQADLSHPEFQVVMMPEIGRRAALVYAWKMLRNQIPSTPSVTTVTATAVYIESDRPACLQIDGDPGGPLPASFCLSEGSVTLLHGMS